MARLIETILIACGLIFPDRFSNISCELSNDFKISEILEIFRKARDFKIAEIFEAIRAKFSEIFARTIFRLGAVWILDKSFQKRIIDDKNIRYSDDTLLQENQLFSRDS